VIEGEEGHLQDPRVRQGLEGADDPGEVGRVGGKKHEDPTVTGGCDEHGASIGVDANEADFKKASCKDAGRDLERTVMGDWIELTAADGHGLCAYRAPAESDRRGGLVVVQEVFGVNAHIRSVCDGFAAHGYDAVAPALFDRLETCVELAYDDDGIAKGRALVGELGWERPLVDVHAAASSLHPEGRVGVVGYCWGGTIAWLAACRLDVACAAAYYGRQIVDFPDDHPRCPTVAHFGAEDALIPLEAVERVRVANPAVAVHLYAGAGHGFNCDARADFRPEAAALALERTLALFSGALGAG
jgi:carboxymethylenebutenolidase